MKIFWDILNKPFTIWFFSTLAVSLVGFLYQRNEARVSAERERTEAINSIDLEISSRLKFFFLNRKNDILIDDALLILDNPQEFVYPTGVYERYSNRNMRSLISELKQLVHEEEKRELEIPLNATYELAEIYLIYNRIYRRKPTIETKFVILDRLNKTLIQNFNIERWRTPTNLTFPELKKVTMDNILQKALDDFDSQFGNDWIEEEIRLKLDTIAETN